MSQHPLGYLLGRLILAANRLLRPDIAARNAWEAHLANVPGLDDQAEYRAACHPCLSRHLSDENLARVLGEWSR